MSRGLGRLQREILATLDDAKAARLRYNGGRAGMGYGLAPGQVAIHGVTVVLPDGVYDLRASLQFLARQHRQTWSCPPYGAYGAGVCIKDAFRTSYSRAARSLIARGVLQWCTHHGDAIPVPPRAGRECRFVRLVDRPAVGADTDVSHSAPTASGPMAGPTELL